VQTKIHPDDVLNIWAFGFRGHHRAKQSSQEVRDGTSITSFILYQYMYYTEYSTKEMYMFCMILSSYDSIQFIKNINYALMMKSCSLSSLPLPSNRSGLFLFLL